MISSLHVSQIRNLHTLDFNFKEGITVFSGKNGSGKTSVLEILYLLCQGYSFKTKSLKDLIHWKSEEAIARIRLNDSTRAIRLQSNSNILAKKGEMESSSASFFFGETPAVIMQPADISLVQGAPEERRRYLDEILCLLSPLNTELLRHYRRVLQQRNQWLRQYRNGQVFGGEDVYAVLTEQFIDLAIRVWRLRIDLSNQLDPSIQKYYHILAEGRDKIHCTYRQSIFKDPDAQNLEQSFREKLEGVEEIERKQGVTILGPHKDDLVLWTSGHEFRSVASQGQSRSAAIAMRFAALDITKKEKAPSILFLDDIFAELDEHRRRAVANLIKEKHTQVFIATPRLEDLSFDPDSHISMDSSTSTGK